VGLQNYFTMFHKRWRFIALVALLAVTVGAALTLASPRVYESRTQFFVSTSGAQDSGQLLQGSSFTQQRVKSYAQLLDTPKVLSPVIQELALDVTSERLARSVTATVPLDTVLIDVAVSDSDPARAASIAGAIGKYLPAAVGDLESVSTDKASPVKVTVVQPPTTETTPVTPRPARDLPLALLLGLALGFGLAMLRDRLDTTIKGQRDLEEVTDSTVIGTMALDLDASAHPLIVQADPRSMRAEAFRSLRTNLQFIDATDHPRSIVITSSIPGEGKTTTAANLALTLAAAGSSVCVVEGDLRSPRLLDYLGLEGAVGLTDVLIGRSEIIDVLQQVGDLSMWVLGAGSLPPNPSELLGSPMMANTLRELESLYDYVLIDATPLLPVTDAAIVSTLVGGVVVVVGAGIVKKEHFSRALASIEAVNGHILGLVLNRLPAKEGASYGNYRYDNSSEVERGRTTRRDARQRAQKHEDLDGAE